MRVLIVEDEPAIRDFLSIAFDEEGEQAFCVGTLSDGREELQTGRYDLMLADIVLPDGSGVDLVPVAARHGVRFILMSGEPSALKLLDGGRIDYLQKPFLLSDLFDVIRRGEGSPTRTRAAPTPL